MIGHLIYFVVVGGVRVDVVVGQKYDDISTQIYNAQSKADAMDLIGFQTQR